MTTADQPFGPWLPAVTPSFRWDWSHLAYVQGYLDRVTQGEIKRLMLFMPPRHGKSEMTTVRYPVYRLEHDPALRVIVGAYSQTLANKFSRKSRRIARERLTLNDERTAVEDWETRDGGGYRAVGVGGGITGQGGDLIIIDDPVKSREEAESEAYRERVWDWYRDDLYTRLEPDGAIILIMTRWHDDDLAGRLLEEATTGGDLWTVVSLPAEAEEDDPLGRPVGAALCPERYDLAALQNTHNVLGRSYYALYQQRPRAREGNVFKQEWFTIVDAYPVDLTRVRYWDKAGTDNDGDYSAGVLIGKSDDGHYYVLDVVRGQWSSHARNAIMRQTAAIDGVDVSVWAEQEPGSGGKESAEATIVNLAGYAIHTEKVTGSKEVRATPFAAQCEAQNVRLVRAPWNKAYIDEMCGFPSGKHDDQVDGSSGAFNKLTQPEVRIRWLS